MKLIFVAVTLFVVATANPISEWKVPTQEQISEDKVICLKSIKNLPPDQQGYCLGKSLCEKLGFFDETNGFNVENVVAMEVSKNGRSESAARAVAEKCAVKKEATETDCDWASRGLDCLLAEQENLPLANVSAKDI